VKVALVHDWLNQIGGAEGVLEELVALYPDAPIFTSIYWPAKMPAAYANWDIRTSFVDRWPLVKQHHQPFLPFYPLAFERFRFDDYDVVISNKSGFCHGIVTPARTLHVCYCLTPTRYLWNTGEYLQREGIGRLGRSLLAPLLGYLRRWDRRAAGRVDRFLAISRAVQERIGAVYGRESQILYPPVQTGRYTPAERPQDYFLSVGRLIPYKRVDLAVAAFNQLGLPLLVVGEGRDRQRLERMAAPNVRFLGRLPDAQVRELLAGCRAFLFPGLEDFGIAPLEAQAAGRPVIAYAGGGALDTLVDGQTGLFFGEQTVEALVAAVRRLVELGDAHFDAAALRRHAERFSAARFRQEFGAFVERAWEEHQSHLCRPRIGTTNTRMAPPR